MTRILLPLLCLTALLAFSFAQSATPVASVHNDCGSRCTVNTTCCGSDSYCDGTSNTISNRCCPRATSQFCGCFGSRAYCNGNVFGYSGPRVTGQDTFGSCYDPNSGFCATSGQNWVVCPNTYSACPSNSFLTCCSAGQQCFTNAGASFPACAFPSGGPTVISPTKGQNLVYGQTYTFRYTPAVAGDTSYDIITGGNNQAFGTGTLESDGTVTVNYTLRSFSPSNGNINLTFVEGNVSTTVEVFATTTPQNNQNANSDTNSNVAAIDTADCQPNGCAGGAMCCGGQCYSTGQYQCYRRTDGAYQLCQQGLKICGSACYNPSQYQCQNEQLLLA